MSRGRPQHGVAGNLDARVCPVAGGRRVLPAALLATLLPLLLTAAPAEADPEYSGPILYGLDPVIHATRDPRLLGLDRQIMRQRLEDAGVRPDEVGRDRPALIHTMRRLWLERARVDLERKERLVELDGRRGTFMEIEYDRYLILFPPRETLPGGFVYYPPRRLDHPDVTVFVDELEMGVARRHAVAGWRFWTQTLDLAGGGKRTQDAGGLINLTIPIKLPRTLERIIGKGEKTSIRISGRERIALTGESTVTKPFIGNERIQSQSLFPSLDMEQELQVNLSGTIGEKIILEVDHNSAAIGPDATKIKLMYRGDEDDIIQTIETGDVGLTLPGGGLINYSSSKTGLFGIKVTGQVGPADFTVLATKQKAESSSQNFNAKGGQLTSHEILSHNYFRNRFFRLSSGAESNPINMAAIDPATILVYRLVGGGQIIGDEVKNLAVYADMTGRFYDNDLTVTPLFRATRWARVPINIDETSPGYGLLVDKDNHLWGVDLGSDQGDDTVLGVTFATTDGTRYGDSPGEAVKGTVYQDGVPIEDESWWRLKLLKAPASDSDPYAHALMIRQIYSLGGANIEPGSFSLRIENTDLQDDTPQYDENGVPYLQIFGLDDGDDYGRGARDEEPDLSRDTLFDLTKGLLKFPEEFAQPFAALPDTYVSNASGTAFEWDEESYLATNLVPEMYSIDAQISLLPEYGKFRFVAEHASASNTISLGSSNIEEDSEVVKVDGKTLKRGEDYDIDYLFGEIVLKEGNFTLTAESQISVTYGYSPFIGGGSTSLLGGNLGYQIGRDSRLSTTWLYQSEAIVGDKAKLGEEPSKNLVGTVNLQHTMRPKILTKVANLLSRHNTEKESSLQFQGEVALSIPNPNTKGQVYLEDFEGIDASNVISLVRTAWTMPAFPIQDSDNMVGATSTFGSTERVGTIRWYRPNDRVPRWYLNPALENQELDDAQSVMELYLKEDVQEVWGSDMWGGISRGVSGSGLDLTQAQFIEVWLNDGQVDPLNRTGRLHIDFGEISEDGYWPDGETGTSQDEDTNNNGAPDVEEDTGLLGVAEPEWSSAYDENSGTFNKINSTRKNRNWDREDANNNGFFDTKNEYFTTVIDLAETDAEVDVVRDYTAANGFSGGVLERVRELESKGKAWRKYRIPMSDIIPITATGDPDLLRVKHVRLWFEDEDRTDNTVRLQLSDLRFLGSRWERDGIRRVEDERILGPADLLPDERFFLGEMNNKENPDYVPPYRPKRELNITEKEQALLIDYTDLAQGHQLMTSRQVSVQGDDYTGYDELTWFWNNTDHRTADLDLFFRVGADTLNYYEIAYRFADHEPKVGWKQMTLDLVELSQVKNAELGEDGVRQALVSDSRSNDEYQVRVVGRPDLRRIKRYYFIVANNALAQPASGRLYLNDVRLLGVKRKTGMAESGGLRVNMADVYKLDFDWSHTDQEYHGLNADKGSGIDVRQWNLSMNFAAQDFVPLLGFRLPVGLSRRQTIKRPKYELNSDIEIIDDNVRNELSTIDTSESFSMRLSHPGSKNPILRYAVDPWSFNINGSQSRHSDPLARNFNKSLQGGVKYDLRIQGRYRLSAYPVFKHIPLVKAIDIVPDHVSFNAGFTNTYRSGENILADGTVTPKAESRTRPLLMDASVDYSPLSVLDINVTGRSERDLLRESEQFGVNIGQENRRTYGTRMTIKPPLAKELPRNVFFKPVRSAARALTALRPSVQFKGGFSDNHGPEVPKGDDPPGTKTVGNNGLWEFRFSLPVGETTKKLFPKKRHSAQKREQILAQEEARLNRLERQGQRDSTVVLTPEETRGLTPDEINELRAERLLEAAQRREEAEADLRSGRSVPGGEAGFPNPLDVVLESLRNMTPLKFTLTNKRSSRFTRYTSDVPFWYRTGLVKTLNRADSLYVTHSLNSSKNLNIATSTKVHRNVSVDLKFNQSTGEKDGNNSVTNDYKQDWPDIRINLSGLERWPVLGARESRDESWFKTSSFTFSYRRSKYANGSTATFYTPTTQSSVMPRWQATLQNGMTVSTSVTMTGDRRVSVGSVTENEGLSISVQLRHQFRAQGFLARMGLYRPGNNPTVTMDVDMSYGRDRNTRTDQTGAEPSVTGINRMSFNPRFSYNITRNLTGSMRLIYSRSNNIQSGQTTTTLGMGLEATFVF